MNTNLVKIPVYVSNPIENENSEYVFFDCVDEPKAIFNFISNLRKLRVYFVYYLLDERLNDFVTIFDFYESVKLGVSADDEEKAYIEYLEKKCGLK